MTIIQEYKMFLRRRDIQPDAIQKMHLNDVLLEIMASLDPMYNEGMDADNSRASPQSLKGGTIIQPKPGQSTAAAIREMKEAGRY